MRQTIKCAQLLYKSVDLNQLEPIMENSREPTSFGMDVSNTFIIETIKRIGQIITNADAESSSKKALGDSELSSSQEVTEEEEKKSEEEEKEKDEQISSPEAPTAEQTEVKQEGKENKFVVYANVNTP